VKRNVSAHQHVVSTTVTGAVIFAFLSGCGGSGQASAVAPAPASLVSTLATAQTATPSAAGYTIGGMNGETCEPKTGSAAWFPTEDLCIIFTNNLPATIAATLVPAAPVTVVYPAIGNQTNVAEFRISTVAGTSYRVTISGQSGPFQPNANVPVFTMRSYSAGTLLAQEQKPKHHESSFYGAFLRTGLEPFGLDSSVSGEAPYPISPTKLGNVQAAHVQIARMTYRSFNDDLTFLLLPGITYDFSGDDQTVGVDLANNITPYIDLEAGPIQRAVGVTEPLFRNPGEFGAWCGTVATHVHATFPTLGTSVPAIFGIPGNEPNNGTSSWDASKSDDPVTYAYNAEGPGLYMKACYAAIKTAFPAAKVYGPELNVGSASVDPITFFTSLYTNGSGCKVGVCFDGLAIHLSPAGDPGATYSTCVEHNFGWTLRCYRDLQAIAVAHGDPKPPVLITEMAIGSVPGPNGSLDEPGQAWWLSRAMTAFETDPSVVGIFWSNIDEDADYVGTPFFGGSLVDTSGAQQRRKASFTTYATFAAY